MRIGRALAVSGTLAAAVGVSAAAQAGARLATETRPTTTNPSGGATLGGLAPTNTTPTNIPKPPSKHGHGSWLRGVTITEYWPSPEKWFVGRLVKTPGLSGLHRIDWLYSATGVSMQGQGIGLDGKLYHIATLGNAGWVTSAGKPTSASDGWSAGAPFWRAGAYWKNRSGGVTFPLSLGGWWAGRGRKYVPLSGVSFAPGPSLPIRFYRSIAVDPRVIPLGSRVYVPAYRHDGYGGWFVAQDTGGAIGGRHIDIYRSPPASSSDPGNYLTAQRIYVIKPKR